MSAAGQEAQPFPWDEISRFGFSVLRLSPAAFWALTPRELAMTMKAVAGRAQPLARTEFERLLQQFPDGV